MGEADSLALVDALVEAEAELLEPPDELLEQPLTVATRAMATPAMTARPALARGALRSM
ncbi:MAG: hypothetical protein NTZ03_03600 [Actinobacteria bacterium]|nr:hypothetical protein [Actinomycetota bacterium]